MLTVGCSHRNDCAQAFMVRTLSPASRSDKVDFKITSLAVSSIAKDFDLLCTKSTDGSIRPHRDNYKTYSNSLQLCCEPVVFNEF